MTRPATDVIKESFAADLAERLGALSAISADTTGTPIKELGEHLASLSAPQLTEISRLLNESAATILGDSLQRIATSIEAADFEAFRAATGTFERAYEALSNELRAQVEPPVVELTPEMARDFFDHRARALVGMSGEEFLRRWDAGEYSPSAEEPERSEIIELVALMPFAR